MYIERPKLAMLGECLFAQVALVVIAAGPILGMDHTKRTRPLFT